MHKKGHKDGILCGADCLREDNKKCDYCAALHHDCEAVSEITVRASNTHAERFF